MVGLVGLAACGRLGFDPVPTSGADAAGDAAGDATGDAPAGPMIVQVQPMYSTNVATTVLPITATQPNDLLVVLTVDVFDQAPLTSISDSAGDAYVSASSTFLQQSAFGETWYAPSGAGGATSLTITDIANHDREVWFVEISGVSALDTANQVSNQSYTTSITAPSVTPTHLPAVILSFVKLTGGVQSVTPPFTPQGVLSGDDTVTAIVATNGTYAPTYTIDISGTYGAATLTFYAP